MPEKLLLRRVQGSGQKVVFGVTPFLALLPQKRVPQKGKKALLGWRREWGTRRQGLTGPSGSGRSRPWGMLIWFSSACRHWASSVHFFRIVAGRRKKGPLRLHSPRLEMSVERALPAWAAAWQEASSSRNRGRGRFQNPLPETERHPFLTLTPGPFQKSLSPFPSSASRAESCRLSGKLLPRIKLRRFPILFVTHVFSGL